ncbi:hypothetical protein [Rubrimonas cliftonensis]|uniref:Uncharacterized protein n=1 Tax=Rubrimonas cliftonensis TaxID=89524 RepID=A0A1H4DTM0_9RHOB|nr:hypothetical protein [Rubrimonas cliftonensis]SEA76071.1 hypothetical protein SAMN05444370_11136 [Rubrimonas cliftonensis]
MPFTLRPLPGGALEVGVAFGDLTYQDIIDGFDEAIVSGRYRPGMDTVNVFLPDTRGQSMSFHAMLRLQERVRAAELAGRDMLSFRAAVVANNPRTRELATAYAALWGDRRDGDVAFLVTDDLAAALDWLGHADQMAAVRSVITAVAQDPAGPNLSSQDALAAAEAVAQPRMP